MSSHFSDDMFDACAPVATREFHLDGFHVRSQHHVVLEVCHAGHTNPAYMNARRKVDGQIRATSGEPTGTEVVLANIPLLAAHVITGWKHVIGADGKPVKYSAAEGEAFLRVIAKKNLDVVGKLLAYVVDGDHFRTPGGTTEALGNG